MSAPEQEPVSLDPGRVLSAYKARIAQELARQADHITALLEEISHLEAYAAQLQQELASARSADTTTTTT